MSRDGAAYYTTFRKSPLRKKECLTYEYPIKKRQNCIASNQNTHSPFDISPALYSGTLQYSLCAVKVGYGIQHGKSRDNSLEQSNE